MNSKLASLPGSGGLERNRWPGCDDHVASLNGDVASANIDTALALYDESTGAKIDRGIVEQEHGLAYYTGIVCIRT